MTNEELKLKFFELAKQIKEECTNVDAYSCENAACPFSRKDEDGDSICIFDWNNLGNPYDWEFDEDEEAE